MANPLRFPKTLLDSVKKVLSLDEEDDQTEIPEFIFHAVAAFLRTNPKDDNFVLECAENAGGADDSVLADARDEEDERKGGEGYGTITCLENDCWTDVFLSADPDQYDGGKANGLGGFNEYRKHCFGLDHIAARDARRRTEARTAERNAEERKREMEDAKNRGSARKLNSIHSLSQAMLARNGVVSPAKKHGNGRTADASATRHVYTISSSDESDHATSSQPKRARPSKPHQTLGGRSSYSAIELESTDEDTNPIARRLNPGVTSEASPKPKQNIGRRLLLSDDDDVVAIDDSKPDIKPKTEMEKKPQLYSSASHKVMQEADYAKMSEKEKLGAEAKLLRKVFLSVNVPIGIGALCKSRGSAVVDMILCPGLPYTPPSRGIVAFVPELRNLRPELERLWAQETAEDFRLQIALANESMLYVKPDIKPSIKPGIKPTIQSPRNTAAGPSRTNAVAGPSRAAYTQVEPKVKSVELLRSAYSMPMAEAAQGTAQLYAAAKASIARYAGIAAGHLTDTIGVMVDGRHIHGDLDDDETRRIERNQAQYGADMGFFFQDNLATFEEATTVQDAARYLRLDNITDLMPGMAVSLMPHQVLAVAFMLKKELDVKARASLLLDAMGLGKTISIIGVMMAHQSEDPNCKTTLIIAPLALLRQWEDEIMTKTDGTLAVHIYHGPQKIKKVKALRKFDVIITTYGTLVSEFPKPEKKRKRRVRAAGDFIDDEDDAEWEAPQRAKEQKFGPLARMHFWRCVLDESHTIRNRHTQAAKACFEIEAEFRISATGTLIVNGVDDLFPHLHFAGLSTCCEWDHFRDHIHTPAQKRPAAAVKRMQAILKFAAIRRTKDSLIDGKAILTLPEKVVDVVEMTFTPEEREIYQTVERRAIVRFNRFLKAGTVMKNYSHVLLMLLRLRQCVLHPQLLTRKRGEGIQGDDYTISHDNVLTGPAPLDVAYTRETERENAKALGGEALLIKLDGILQRRADDRVLSNENDEPTDDDCPICSDQYVDEIITACGHSFCHDCLQQLCEAGGNVANMDDGQARARLANSIGSCPMCRTDIKFTDTFRAKAFEPHEVVGNGNDADDDELDLKPELKGKKYSFKSGALAGAYDSDGSQAAESDDDEEHDVKPRLKSRNMKLDPDDSDGDSKPDLKPSLGKGKGKGRVKDEYEEEMEVDELQESEERQLVPSTKMMAMIQQLEEWLDANPDDKILVFSQFTTFLAIVSDFLGRNNIEHDLYVGKMSRQAREDTIKHFKKRNSCRVLLVSLKCGGTGLNLSVVAKGRVTAQMLMPVAIRTIANKVINLDLAWNAASEEQAVDRVHRIGQTKEVSVKRIVIMDSVEQRIMALQEKKKALADGALGEGGAGRLGRLTLQDLVSLFTRSYQDDE